MLTETEKNLIRLLKSFGLDKETTVSIAILAKTDENRKKMMKMIIELYYEKGIVTEQDIQKIGLMLTGKRKSSMEERYSNEVLTNNAAISKCEQCKDCIFRDDGTVYSNDYRKGSCCIFPYPAFKPIGVMHNTEPCEFYEKDDSH